MKHARIDRKATISILPGPHQDGLEHGTDKADLWVGTNFADRYDGGQGSDTIYGGNGSDVLEGSSGKDFIYGGNGDDIMRGGSGADRFIFMSAGEASGAPGLVDRITDFQTGSDKIDLRAFMDGGKFVGTGPLVAGGGKQVAYDRAHAMLLGDVNGDGVADFQIYLNGAPVVAADDFLF